ncbi:goadsporin biosynthesis protein [Planomonospora sphaerica]|uniref:Goadsporin biosynthesis protein n=1 Tax=Planomonospora sphaerica TaxID=161355 RepID=A0A161LKC5_9ACTN|nr:TOMM precursor leader peptide-binding protein [Planomonospora sphaerica]GAT67155.1 goadsporin biosynthesis protein [Planomonospora sphaerica]
MEATGRPLIGFRRHLRAETVPGEGVYLTSARGATVLSGPLVQQVAPLLDGTRDLAQVQRAAPGLPAGRLGELLGRLARENLIGYRRPDPGPAAGPAAAPAALAYWELAGLDGDAAADRLTAARVRVAALGGLDTGPAAAACRAAGLTLAEDPGGPADLTIVLCDDYLDPALREVNRDRLRAAGPWLPVRPGGADVWVGPVFRPGQGPCWACLEVRLRGHLRVESCLRDAPGGSGRAPFPDTSLAPARAIGLQSAVLEAAKWLAGSRHPGQDAVWILDTLTLESRRHPVARRPQCPECGDPGLVAERVRSPITVSSRRKAVADGTGHRALTPEQMWERYGHLADPVTGVTDTVRRDPRSPSFLHSYLSGPNLALRPHGLSAVRAGLRRQSGGKGTTEAEARVSALCEAVERYCASRFGDEPVVRDSFRGLGGQAVHPDACQLFHPRQFAERARWNAANAPFHHVPEPFDEEAVVEWTPVRSLVTGLQRLLPTAYLYFHDAGALPSVRANSNGNAAGSSIEDAILQGFLELVERDAVGIWWYNRTRHPAVRLDSLGDPWIAGVPEHYRRLNREVWLLDVTSDLGIPAMAAVSRRVDKPAQDIMLGFGAHFDPRVAARRALAELSQLLPAVAGARPDGTGYGESDPHLRRWWHRATVEDQPYLAPDPGLRPRVLTDYAYTPRADLGQEVGHVRALARRKGLDVLVLDQTRPDVGMPVVKVVVPGLRHFWARFAPGRLYDVPVLLGRLAEPTGYEQLNPVPLFM